MADASAHRGAKHTHRLSAQERTRIRKSLARELRRNPASVFTKSFIRKADLVEFHLPMTVRLDKSDGQGGFLPSDDQMEIDWDDSVFTWPLTGGALAAPQTVNLTGGFTMEGIFNGGDTSGYGVPGATETIVGGGITMASDPFTISEFATSCSSGPQLTTDPASQVSISSAGSRYGLMNPFSQEIQGTLSLHMTFASSVASTCGATPALTPAVDNSSAPPMPLRFDGTFRISPGFTPDGKMRFGKITIDDAVTAQLSTFAYVRACTDATNCTPEQFPGRLKLKKMTADVLLGDVFPR